MSDPVCSICKGGADPLSLCNRCAKNLQMLDVADGAANICGQRMGAGGFPGIISNQVPADAIFFVPSREALERALEHDETPDLRRYFGMIKNLGH